MNLTHLVARNSFGLVLVLAAALLAAGPWNAARAADGVTIRLALDGVPLEGTPVAWNNSKVMLLGRNGYLLQFSPSKVEDFKQISS